jgi:hypothetical protein
MNAYERYQEALVKLRAVAQQKDFTEQGEIAYFAAYNECKRWYLAACLESEGK